MNKNKHLRVRVTESQLKRLMSKIKKENISISEVIRDLIDNYLSGICRDEELHK